MHRDNYCKFTRSPRNSSVWLFVLSAITLAGILFGTRIYVDYNQTVSRSEERLLAQTKVIDENITTNLTVVNLMLNDISREIAGPSDKRQLNRDLQQKLVMTPGIRTVMVVDHLGRCIHSNRTELLGKDFARDRDYFKAPRDASDKGQLFISPPYTTLLGKYVINITKPLSGKQGEFKGVVSVTLDPEYFTELLKSTIYTPDNRVSLVHSDGTVFIALPEAKIPVTGIKVTQPGSAFLQHISHGRPTSILRASGMTLGDKRLFAYRTNIPAGVRFDRQIIIAASRNMDALLAQWRMDAGIELSIYLLLAVLAVASTRIMLRQQSERNQVEMQLFEVTQRLEALMNAVPVGISFSDDITCQHITGNPTVLAQFEMSLGDNLSASAPDADAPGRLVQYFKDSRAITDAELPLQRAVAENKIIPAMELEVLMPCGKRWFTEISGAPVRDAQGIIIGGIAVTVDITERKQAEDALRKIHEELESRIEERTSDLAEAINILKEEIQERQKAELNLQRLNRLYAVLRETNQTIVNISDRDSLFRDFCRIAVEHGGFVLSWIGLVDWQSDKVNIVASSGANSYLNNIRISLNNEPEGEGPTGIVIREGSYYICNDFQNDPCTRPWHDQGKKHGIGASASIAIKENDLVIGALTLYGGEKDYFDEKQVELLLQMGMDISFALDNLNRESSRKEAEKALYEETSERLKAIEALREKEQMLIQQSRQAAMGEMIGNIAHQWRQPLNTLGLHTQRLGLLYGSSSFNKEILVNSIAKSMEIIKHMSKTIDDFRDYFKPEKEKAAFQVIATIKNTLSLLESNFQQPKISIHIEEQDSPAVHGYQNEFSQVILNILNNARDALIERHIADPRIIIKICSENGCTVVTIADNAGGIPEEILTKIFDPYFTTKGPQQGTGIGLFMSKTIIEKNMGGRLTVGNTAEGAEFRIEVGNVNQY